MEKYINVSKNMALLWLKKKNEQNMWALMPPGDGSGKWGRDFLDTNIQLLNKVKSENCNVFLC